jgi:8-oxo-dGTP pyrophosphatase MutT (NUDIX family)
MIPTLSRPPFINKLHDRLVAQPLPGPPAHLAMAHAVRRVDPSISGNPAREAGVLIVLFEKSPGGFHVVFIRRGSSHEQDKHAGQIGFPGGKSEPGDKDMMYTAMREAEEEVGIDLSQVDILGPLTPIYITVSKYLVHPFVAYSCVQPHLIRQESEIEEILELPLSDFRSPMAIQETKITLATGITLNHVPCFQVNGHIIWGATAMIMNELLEVMS